MTPENVGEGLLTMTAEPTDVEKHEVKLRAVSTAAELAAGRVRDACRESENVSELVNELDLAKTELEALVELCDGEKGMMERGN